MCECIRFVKTFVHSHRDIIGKFQYVGERFSTKIVQEMFFDKKKSSDQLVSEMIVYYQIRNKNIS